ncbi:MAG: hypothetical protein MAG431_01005 [Chloroflexi bacterium]|nr:hypothetical protein [Chloroflexota bacterium]
MPHSSFPITRHALDQYPISPKSELADIAIARRLAYAINYHKKQTLTGGEISALGLLGKIYLRVIQNYQEQRNLRLLPLLEEWLYAKTGEKAVETTFLFTLEHFPPEEVFQQALSAGEYLQTSPSGENVPHQLYPSLLLLLLAVENSAIDSLETLVRDPEIREKTPFPKIISHLNDFFQTQPTFGPHNQTFLEMLRAPFKANPNSLVGQLEYIRKHWHYIIGEEFLTLLLRNLDVIREEEKFGLTGPGPARTPDFNDLALAPEERRFSPDSNWMPKAVLIAKNAYVWLDQLSKQYQREIARLDQIPDEELAKLSRWGFTALWLIGLWERSSASQRIKQMCGNPDAVSSAYSLYDYTIANDLGGESAYNNLRHRAGQHGVQMAADMVPNHVGIYSKWVIEHPDWFLSLNEKPYPAYSFNGANLSEDERVGIYLEDGYYDKTDAAVVFKRVDRHTGDVKYIYHGNDGTAMPWNDTAQLDYRNPHVREAVIQTILHVARRAPIIRFDAAMTLSKKHYQRLWFPAPGTGGAIPTRAEQGLSPTEFDQAIPHEFWREVVDRVAAEAPNTLLLAEAFWMMEGYFVRTLGMHRVYNSAFMNMLRDEDNAKYQDMILKTLEFDPQILKRYVNFMNNPDEDTAISQFGADDKYFGICTLMATLPGLPMFGHGQVEGFTEKYGMEYKRAYYDETPNQGLIARHEREIFPLLHNRYLFAEVDHFVLYEFTTGDGPCRDVFAYSNRVGSEQGLVVYHNKWGDVRGWVRDSAAVDGHIQAVGHALALRDDPGTFTVFRDAVTDLEYIRPTEEIFQRGLYFELGAYKTHVLFDFHQVEGEDYAQLNQHLNGNGVISIKEALWEQKLGPVRKAFQDYTKLENFYFLFPTLKFKEKGELFETPLASIETNMMRRMLGFNTTANAFFRTLITTFVEDAIEDIEKAAKLVTLGNVKTITTLAKVGFRKPKSKTITPEIQVQYYLIFLWRVIYGIDEKFGLGDDFNQMLITSALESAWELSEEEIHHNYLAIKIMLRHQNWFQAPDLTPSQILETWLTDQEVRHFLDINTHDGITWFQKEAFEKLLFVIEAVALTMIENDTELTEKERKASKSACQTLIAEVDEAKEESGYQVGALRRLVAN